MVSIGRDEILLIATNIFQDDKDIENRVDEEGDSDGDDGDGVDTYGFDG